MKNNRPLANLIFQYLFILQLILSGTSCSNSSQDRFDLFRSSADLVYSLDSTSGGDKINWSLLFSKDGTWSQYYTGLNDSLYLYDATDIAYDHKYDIYGDSVNISEKVWHIEQYDKLKLLIVNRVGRKFYFSRIDTDRIGSMPPN